MHVTGKFSAVTSILALATATPLMAQDDVTERDPNAMDVAMTPLADLNLSKDAIPPVLLTAQQNPYANAGLSDCGAIQSQIGNLDAVLGDDFDSAPPDERRITPAGVAQRAVGMLIPFRGIIREVSGANAQEYKFREAIAAGLMRRAYLKGLGEARGCDYPARPMPPEMLERLSDVRDIADKGVALTMNRAEPDSTQSDVSFESRPVVQGED